MFTTDAAAVMQQGADMFEELAIPWLTHKDMTDEAWRQMRQMYSAGYAAGFAHGQKDVVDALDALTTPDLPTTPAGPQERQSR